jgi:hypothetical protein
MYNRLNFVTNKKLIKNTVKVFKNKFYDIIEAQPLLSSSHTLNFQPQNAHILSPENPQIIPLF